MYKNVLTSIPGIEYYPIVALLLFFGFFTVLLVWFFRVDTTNLEEVARQPLDDDKTITDKKSPQTLSGS